MALDWLRRTNKPDGRFVYGFLPALCTSMEGDSYLRQAGAAGALAAAARYFGDEASTAIARQAFEMAGPPNGCRRHHKAVDLLVTPGGVHGDQVGHDVDDRDAGLHCFHQHWRNALGEAGHGENVGLREGLADLLHGEERKVWGDGATRGR